MRGIAILMMIVFHVLFDLAYLGAYTLNARSGFWLYFARATATIFLLLVGISLTLSFSRAQRMHGTRKLYLKYLRRGLKIFAWGLVITVITWLVVSEGFVVFGILHLIGISIILAYPLLKHRYANLELGTVLIALGIYVKNVTVDEPWLLWLGLTPTNFYTLDYFPLVPWFGVVLIGVFLGNSLYANYTRSFKLRDLSTFPIIRFLTFLGRHSLLIYLVHQPILIMVLAFFGFVDTSFLAFL